MAEQLSIISPFHPVFDVWSIVEDYTEEHHWWLADHPWKGGFACVSKEAAEFAANLLNKNNSYLPSAKNAAQK